MVPAARPAHLDDKNAELLVQTRHPMELVGGPSGPSRMLELVTVHPRDQRQGLLAAHGAGDRARLTVELRRSQEVRGRVADLGEADPAGIDLREQRTPLQRVVHDLSLGPHAQQTTQPIGDQRSGVRAAPSRESAR